MLVGHVLEPGPERRRRVVGHRLVREGRHLVAGGILEPVRRARRRRGVAHRHRVGRDNRRRKRQRHRRSADRGKAGERHGRLRAPRRGLLHGEGAVREVRGGGQGLVKGDRESRAVHRRAVWRRGGHIAGRPRYHHRVGLRGLAVAGRHLRLDRVRADPEVDLEAGRVAVGVGQRRVGAVEVVHPGAAVALDSSDRDLIHRVGHGRGVGGLRRVECRVEHDVGSGAAIVPCQAEVGQRGVAGGNYGMAGDLNERHLVSRRPDP